MCDYKAVQWYPTVMVQYKGTVIFRVVLPLIGAFCLQLTVMYAEKSLFNAQLEKPASLRAWPQKETSTVHVTERHRASEAVWLDLLGCLCVSSLLFKGKLNDWVLLPRSRHTLQRWRSLCYQSNQLYLHVQPPALQNISQLSTILRVSGTHQHWYKHVPGRSLCPVFLAPRINM